MSLNSKIVPIAVLLDPSYDMFTPDTRVAPHPEPDGDEDEDPDEMGMMNDSHEEELDAVLARFYSNLVGHAASSSS